MSLQIPHCEFRAPLATASAFALAMLWNSAAYAQPAPTPAQPETSPSAQPSSPSTTPPAPLRRSPDCDSYLPPGFKIPPESAPTMFWFRVDLQGNVQTLSLYRSSGNNELDQAALTCVNSLPRSGKPFTQNGTPIDVTWVSAITWNYPRHHLTLPDPSGNPHFCAHSGYLKPGMMVRPLGGNALVAFRLGTDGSVKDATIKQSAGSSSLDRAALDCVSAWLYLPALHNGVPVEIDHEIEVGLR